MSRPTFGNRKEVIPARWTFDAGATFNGSVIGGNIGYKGQGKEFWLDPVSGSDGYDGTVPTKAKKTLDAAYALMTANKNDVLYYVAASSGLTLTAAFDWSKAMTHFVGISSGTMIGSRARIFSSTTTGMSPFITISGNGCRWQNIYVSHEVSDATGLIAVSITGDWCCLDNCQFVGGNAAAAAINDMASLYLNGSANLTVTNCVFGAQSIPVVDGANVLRYGTTACGQNYFYNCFFHQMATAGQTAAYLVECLSGASTDRWTLFDRCKFLVWPTGIMATAFLLPAAGNGLLFLQDCVGYGFTAWDSNDRGSLCGNMNAVTAADASGRMVGMYA